MGLQICQVNARRITDILKTAKNLKKLYIHPTVVQSSTLPFISNDELKTVIPQIFECKSLEFFHFIVTALNVVPVFEGIGCGLFKTKRMKRKRIKIRVDAFVYSKLDPDLLVFNVAKIINFMKDLNVRDFMLILDLNRMEETFRNNLDKNKILTELNDISLNIRAMNYDLCFVLTNEDCSICGWNEQWMHNG